MSDTKVVPLTREEIEELRESLYIKRGYTYHATGATDTLCDMALQSLALPAAQVQSEGERMADELSICPVTVDQRGEHFAVLPYSTLDEIITTLRAGRKT